MNNPSKVESILLAALEKATAEARSAYLDGACQDNPGLREQVNRLLSAHPKAVEFLEKPVAAVEEKTAVHLPTVEQPGSILVGRYKLVEMIGEGGMGTVWVAQQTEPVKRVVAVKLIKAGMDSKAVLARFEAERQALALMDHPNIARILDGGATPDGRPFFVMELVKGVPITQFCDARRLTPRQRLELFVPVCQAIQHAHQKGVIHRDIKPSNVLIALYDDKPVPKVIDFGIAKATGQTLTDKSLMTGFGSVVGTPEYMSPEQASLNNLDIDTRSDVYSLGVLLYELLAGSPPFHSDDLKKAGLLEMLRVVREEEPPRPSIKLSTANKLPSISADRGTEPKKLTGLLRNELDWIVMKSLEKDRTRRYETVNGFAADVQRYLAGEAVQAHPPSAAYRLTKFGQKHRVAIATISAFVGMLIAAVGVSGVLAINASRARTEAEENARHAKQNEELYYRASTEAQKSRLDAEFKAIGFQIDLDLAELGVDLRVGLLRLARPMETEFDPFPFQPADANKVPPLSLGDRVQPLQEFVAATVITLGQGYAQLRPPLTQDRDDQLTYTYSLDGSTFLTSGHDDQMLRLWDTRTASLKGKLHQNSEVLIGRTYSPDSKTILTMDQTGMIRFWSAETAKLLSRIEDSPAFYETADNQEIEAEQSRTRQDKWEINRANLFHNLQHGNNRLITKRVKAKQRSSTGDTKVIDQEFVGPVELWDTQTGKLITRLDQPESDIRLGFYFDNQSKWVVAREGKSTYVILSANDGKEITRLIHPTGGEFTGIYISPRGKRIAVEAKKTDTSDRFYFWESTPWRLLPRIAETEQLLGIVDFATDDLVRSVENVINHAIYDFDDPGKLTTAYIGVCLNHKDSFWMVDSNQILDSKTKKRLVPPPGRKYHPGIAKFTQDGRFLFDKYYIYWIDVVTEKKIESPSYLQQEATLDGFGSVYYFRQVNGDGAWQGTALFPAPRFLKIPPELLQLWVQVAVRGELDPAGEFVPWNEQAWEKKRHELAEFPPPHPEFPFPGFLATDKLHWLRAEFQAASDNSEQKRALAEKLLRRAEEVGNTVEANRWQAWLKR